MSAGAVTRWLLFRRAHNGQSVRVKCTVALALAVAVLAGACGDESVADEESAPVTAVEPADRTYVAGLVRALNMGVYRMNDITHFEEVTRAPSEPSREVSIVLGTVVGVEKGAAQGPPQDEDNPEAGGRLPFDTPDASWKSVNITVDVTEVLVGDAAETIRVGLALPGSADFERIKADILDLGTVVLPIYRSPVFDYDDELHGIWRDGSLLLVVDKAGRLSAPYFEANPEPLLDNTPTLDQLKVRVG
jgi:hypothetical protein